MAPSSAQLGRALGICLRALRRNIGIAQEQLALKAQIDRGYMSGLERGLHSPTLETIYKLLPSLGVSFTQFAAEFEVSLKEALRNQR